MNNENKDDKQPEKGKRFDVNRSRLIPIKLKRPREIKEREDTKNNPFSTTWKFPVKQSMEYYYLENGRDKRRTTQIKEDDLMKIEKGQFRLHLLDDTHVRIYQTENEELRKRIYGMEGGEAILLWYILFNMDPGEHSVKLEAKRVANKLTINRSTFYNHIKRLIALRFIAKATTRNKYYINVQLFCAGTRGFSFPHHCISEYGNTYSQMKEKFKEFAKEVVKKRGNRENDDQFSE